MKATLYFLILLYGWARLSAAIVTWDGEGGDLTWQTAANWSGDLLPGINDDVLINTGNGLIVTSTASVTVRSVQSSNSMALTAGTFRVSGGDSHFQGGIYVTGNPVLSATGAGTQLLLPNATNVDRLGIEALAGARVWAPSVNQFSKGSGCAAVVWRADESNSVLDLPALTNLAGADCASFSIYALRGGAVLLTNLVTLSEGTSVLLADGTNSIVNLSRLQRATGTALSVTLEARNGGTMYVPEFSGGRTVTVILKLNGTLAVEQLSELSGFTVVGGAVHFDSLTNLTHGNISVMSNAVVTASNLMAYEARTTCYSGVWQVSGTGSILEFSGMTNMVGPGCGSREARASGGGTFRLPALRTIGEGTLKFSVDGTDSLMDLSSLERCDAVQRTVTFEAANSGILDMPLYQGNRRTLASVANGGVMPLTSFRELYGFEVSAMNVTFASLTNLWHGHVLVENGGTADLPGLTHHDHAGTCSGAMWHVRGAGSVLNLSNLNVLSGATCGRMTLHADNGGRIELDGLAGVADGTIVFSASGAGSLVQMPALTNVSGGRLISFEAEASGEIVAPLFHGNTNVAVTMASGGVYPAGQMRRLNGFSVLGMNVNFAALTNLASGNIIVNGGGVASAPNLVSHVDPAFCGLGMWLATGAGSVLDFSSLTNLGGPPCGAISIQATEGGQVLLPGVQGIDQGSLAFLADDDSVINLSGLHHSAVSNRTISFEARNSGSILVPQFDGGETVIVVIRSGGQFHTSELQSLKSLTVSGTSLTLPGITNLFFGNLIVEQGAVLSLPGIRQHDQSQACPVNTWTVTGAGSVLELLSLTNLVGSSCGSLSLSAVSGGFLNLSNLLTIAEGTVSFTADGTGSVIALDGLHQSHATQNAVLFEARNRGELVMPNMLGGPTVHITIKTNGILPATQLEVLRSVTVVGTKVTLTALTNIDRGSFTVLEGATVTAPALSNYSKGDFCDAAIWHARGAESVLDLSSLREVRGGTCVPLVIQATNGGHVLLNTVAYVTADVTIDVHGAGSTVALLGLLNVINTTAGSRIAATNAGSVVLPGGPAFFSGVTLEFSAGTPGLPVTRIGATNLVMRGLPWRSYWAEYRDPDVDPSPWAFLGRIPLTNEFQVIAPASAANVEYQAWEFVAEPYLLDLHVRQGTNVQLTLFAPSDVTVETMVSTNLAPTTWQVFDTIVMTNTFRLLPVRPMQGLQEFFRARPL